MPYSWDSPEKPFATLFTTGGVRIEHLINCGPHLLQCREIPRKNIRHSKIFAIGFALYLPFVAIDLAVASILMGLGMFMLSPPIISLPCKLLLFVMVDGWALICGGLAQSFR